MAEQDYLSYLFPLAAFGGTLAASANNPDAGQRLGTMAMQGLNYINSRDTQDRYMRQQELTELLRVGSEAAKLGQVQAVAPIEARLRELGFVGGLLPVAQEQAARYQQANNEFMALESGLSGAPGSIQPMAYVLPPVAPATPPAQSQQIIPVPPDAGPQALPPGPMPTSNATRSRVHDQGYHPLNAASSNNLQQYIWELDDQIAQAAPGSDERGALIDKMVSASNELQQYHATRAIQDIPEGIDQDALSAEISALKHGRDVGSVTPQDAPAQEGDPAAQQGVLILPPPIEASAAPVLRPIPGGTISRSHPDGRRSISISRNDVIEQNKELAARYYMEQVNNGIPPAMAMARLERQGFIGDLTKDLWSDAWRRAYTDLHARFTMAGDPVAEYRAFQAASAMTGGRGIPQEMVSTAGKFPDVNDIRLRDALLPKAGGIPTFDGSPVQSQQPAGGLAAFDAAEKKRLSDLAGAEAGQRQRATDQAKLDAPLDIESGGRTSFARLKPGGMGVIEKPGDDVRSLRDAKSQGYVNVSQYHKDLASARDAGNVLVQISDMRKYMDAIIKANPGTETLTQGVMNFLNSLTSSGAPTGILSPDGSRPLTTGEVVSLYNGEKNALMNRVARSIGSAVGTQTEGDIFREIKEWPGLSDTAAIKDLKLYDLQKKVFNEQQSLLRGVFGQEAVNKAYQGVELKDGLAGPLEPVIPGESRSPSSSGRDQIHPATMPPSQQSSQNTRERDALDGIIDEAVGKSSQSTPDDPQSPPQTYDKFTPAAVLRRLRDNKFYAGESPEEKRNIAIRAMRSSHVPEEEIDKTLRGLFSMIPYGREASDALAMDPSTGLSQRQFIDSYLPTPHTVVTLGAQAAAIPPSLYAPPLAPAFRIGAGAAGEAASQWLGFSPPDAGAIGWGAVGAAIPEVGGKAVGLLRQMGPKRGAEFLNNSAPEFALQEVNKYKSGIDVDAAFNDVRANYMEKPLWMPSTNKAIMDAAGTKTTKGRLQYGSETTQADNREAMKRLTALREMITTNKPAGRTSQAFPGNIQEELSTLRTKIRETTGAEKKAYQEASLAMIQDLERTAAKEAAGTMPDVGAGKLLAARAAYLRDETVDDMGKMIEKAFNPMAAQGGNQRFNSAMVMRELRDDPFFAKAFTAKEQNEIRGLFETLNKIPLLQPPGSSNFGSGRFWTHAGMTAAAGGAIGYGANSPLAGVAASVIAAGIPTATATVKNALLAWEMPAGKALLKELWTSNTPAQMISDTLGAYVGAKMRDANSAMFRPPSEDQLKKLTDEAASPAARAREQAPLAPTSLSQEGSPGSIQQIIDVASQKTGLPPALLNAVIQRESSGNSEAVSPKGATGLMQLMPDTAKQYGVSDPRDPYQNIMAGAQYLSDLLARYNGNISLALAAYNAGPGAVAKYGNTIPPFKETQDYVSAITRRYRMSENN